MNSHQRADIRWLNSQLGIFLLAISSWFYCRRKFEVNFRFAVIEAIAYICLVLVIVVSKKLVARLWLIGSIAGAILLFVAFNSEVNLQGVWYVKEDLSRYPQYWRGFGTPVALVALSLTTALVSLFLIRPRLQLCVNRKLGTICNRLLTACIVVIGVALTPALLQGASSWLNLGDGSNKVLDEITGYVIGNYPGVDTLWSHSSILGLPLSVMQILPNELTGLKVYSMIAWVNLLCLSVPVLIGKVSRIAFPRLPVAVGYLVGVLTITVSGSGAGNTSLFQELNYLSRLLMPMLLGVATVRFLSTVPKLGRLKLVLLASLGIATALNNLEFGAPAFAASGLLLILDLRRNNPRKSLILTYSLACLVASFLIVVPALLAGGSWFQRRCGVFCSAFNSLAGTGIGNNTGPIPVFGVTTVLLSLAAIHAIVFVRYSFGSAHRNFGREFEYTSAFFGCWVVMLSPYILHGTGGGAFRSQVQIPLLVVLALLFSSRVFATSGPVLSPASCRLTVRSGMREAWTLLPAFFLVATVPALLLQVPNPVGEFRRLVNPQAYERRLDVWSPGRIDYLEPEVLVSLTKNYGGPGSVGWWSDYGNSVQLLTGIHNDSGVNGFEYTRDRGYNLRLACESLVRGNREYYLTQRGYVGRMSLCAGTKVQVEARFQYFDLVMVRVGRDGA